MRNSGSGALVIGSPPEATATVFRARPPAPKPVSSARWSGSIHELARTKQQVREASQPARRPEAPSPKPAASSANELAGIRLSGEATAPSARSRLSLFHRQWSSDRRWHAPCWLTSFVLHLLAIVVLGSITIPVSRQRTVMAILLSFGDVAENEDGPVELGTAVSLAATEVATDLAHADVEVVDEQPMLPVTPALTPTIPLPPGSQVAGPQTGAVAEAPDEKAAPEPHGAPIEEKIVGSTREIDTRHTADDLVVARFIEFDVGRLTGAEGLKARENFDRLGSEAIASLIRGLNRSARIHASCPVVVISHKVGTVLSEHPDPALLRYALENIGRDVPGDAPHIGHLQALVSRLRQLDPSNSTPSVSMLVASLKSRDAQGAVQAANVVTAEGHKLADFEKNEVAWALIHLLTHRDAKLRAAAHEALVALAKGTDFGPANDRQPPDRIAAACRWSLEFCPERFEAAAESVLKSAEHLAEAGKGDAARRYYKRLVHEYAGTAAADEAAAHLKQLRNFAFK